MANSYSAPNFNIDTDVDIDGLTPLKGSAPALTDKIYVYNGATLSWPPANSATTLDILKIFFGETSGGAAPAGQKYGFPNFTKAGCTVTFAGAASYTDSGIDITPPSPGAESKDCFTTIRGAEGSPIVFTNDGDAADVAKRWGLQLGRGSWDITWAEFRYSGGGFMPCQSDTATSNGTENIFDHCNIIGVEGGKRIVSITGSVDIPAYFRFCTITNAAGIDNGFVYTTGSTGLTATGLIDVSGLRFIAGGANARLSSIVAVETATGNAYWGQMVVKTSDIRPTEVVPADFVVSDATSAGGLVFTWSNGGSYSSGDDWVHIYNDDGDAELGVFDASLGTCEIGGFTVGVEVTAYSKASSDGYNFSAESNTDSGTPTVGTIPRPTAPGYSLARVGANATVTISGVGAAEKTYVRYKDIETTVFSAESEALSRVGNGDIALTGLLNPAKEYDIYAYVKS